MGLMNFLLFWIIVLLACLCIKLNQTYDLLKYRLMNIQEASRDIRFLINEIEEKKSNEQTE